MKRAILFIILMLITTGCQALSDQDIEQMQYGSVETSELGWITSFPRYFCPIHGEIGGDTLEFDFSDLKGKYCFRCIADFLESNFPQVKEVKDE